MKKFLLAFITILGTLTASNAQQTISISTSATSLNDIKISSNGYILEETSPGVYAQKTITITSTNDPGDGVGGYNNCFFVVKDNGVPQVNVATAGTLTTANAKTVFIDGTDPAINIRTWEISLLTLSSGNIPIGTIYDFRATGGVSPAPAAVEVVASYSIPTVEKLVYNFNTNGDKEDFSAVNSNTAVAANGSSLVITANAASSTLATARKTNPANYVNASTYKFVHVTYRNTSANTQLRMLVGGGGQNIILTPSMASNAAFTTVIANLTNVTQWTGNIDTFDFQFRYSNAGSYVGSIEIDKIEFKTDATLGIDEIGNSQVVLFPNPTTGEINIPNAIDFKTITIYNLLGAAVKTIASQSTIDVSDLATGTYILTTNTGATSKIVKK
ncbi:T9SS type A sorting domain-containing protein [Flavobacterium sp.]|uniref:T9SS type A sorting domain-containing protein n=1 Tax=Flavobacterium sp. TaxID=239 RepID=UPI003C38CA68